MTGNARPRDKRGLDGGLRALQPVRGVAGREPESMGWVRGDWREHGRRE
jgi:hypothetical protein